jgi:hypothetical protein
MLISKRHLSIRLPRGRFAVSPANQHDPAEMTIPPKEQ